jgi:hypothetical protein
MLFFTPVYVTFLRETTGLFLNESFIMRTLLRALKTRGAVALKQGRVVLRKIVVLIGSMLLAGVALAEDAPLPFDDPAAAPPIVRKTNPAKAATAPIVASSKVKTTSKKAYTSNRKASKGKSYAKKSKAVVSPKKSAKSSTKSTSAKKKSTPKKTKSTKKTR